MKKIIYCFFVMLICSLCFFACDKGEDSSVESSQTSSSVTSEEKEPNIYFVNNEITVVLGKTAKAEIVTSKNNVFIFWSIRDGNLASVSNDGTITGLALGETICYAEFAGEKVMCLIKIVEQQATPMLSVSVPYENATVALYVGDTLNLKASVKLGDSILSEAEVTYTVSNTDVVSVEEGKATALAEGTATVTITATYEGQSATMQLTVNVVAL